MFPEHSEKLFYLLIIVTTFLLAYGYHYYLSYLCKKSQIKYFKLNRHPDLALLYDDFLIKNPDLKSLKDRISYGVLADNLFHWYIDERPACIGYNTKNEKCEKTQFYCSGKDNLTYGTLFEQFKAIHQAETQYDLLHESCPSGWKQNHDL